MPRKPPKQVRKSAPSAAPSYDKRRDRQDWRRRYKTARWQALRWSILVRDHFTCKSCGKLEGNTSQLHCDHIEKHEGNEARFWDADNLQTLCAHCHNSRKQSEERGGTPRPTFTGGRVDW